jgi:hypothetical protein
MNWRVFITSALTGAGGATEKSARAAAPLEIMRRIDSFVPDSMTAAQWLVGGDVATVTAIDKAIWAFPEAAGPPIGLTASEG